RTLAGRRLAARAADLPDARTARQLPARGARRRPAGLHPVPPRRGRLSVLPGQPRRPQGPAERHRHALHGPTAAVLRVERWLPEHLPRDEEVTPGERGLLSP